MANQVLCTCVWCLQESDGQGRSVDRATRTRHLTKQKKTWPNPAELPVQRRFSTLSTPLLVETTAALSMPPPTSILAPSKTSQYERDQDYGNDMDDLYLSNREETGTYNSMILSNDDDENNQIEMLEDEGNSDDQIEMFEGEEYTGESENFSKLMIKVHVTL